MPYYFQEYLNNLEVDDAIELLEWLFGSENDIIVQAIIDALPLRRK